MVSQLEAMKTANVLVATPGRLLDHLQQGNLDLSGIFSFVLDEADKMVEMGFIEDIEEILSYTPEDRQFLLFGATIAGEIEDRRVTLRRAAGWARPLHPPAGEVVQHLLAEGWEHHPCLVYDDLTVEFAAMARLAGLDHTAL